MRRLLVAACLISGIMGTAAYAADDGNSAAALLCQKGGYANLMRTDGSMFSNAGQCVSYAAHGGQLVPIPAYLVLTEPTIISTPKCWAGVTAGVTPTLPALFDSKTYGNPGATLCFQADGNLVIYAAGHIGDPAYALWNTYTYGNPGASLNFQSDGNLVIYTPVPTTALWWSGTFNPSGECVIFQGDGNLVIYTGCTAP